ncbi:MAG: PAS domain S-box protein [Verrucomicrobiia bacterium]
MSAGHVFIVEDDAGLVELFRMELGRHDLCCDSAGTGREAAEWLATHKPDLLLLDYSLPDTCGTDLITKLTAAGTLPPFIITTGHGDENVAVSLMKLGARDYLIKDATLLERVPAVVLRVLQTISTEKKLAAAEQSLRETEERYRGLYETSPVAIFEEDFTAVRDFVDTLRRDGVTDFRRYFNDQPEAVTQCASQVHVLDVNTTCLRLYGAGSKAEMLNHLEDVFTPETYQVFRDELIAFAEGKTLFSVETANRTINNDLIHVHLTWSLLPSDASGQVKAIVAVMNVTALKQSAERLQESEDKFSAFMQFLPGLASIKDDQHRYLFASPILEQSLGVPPNGLTGKTLDEIMPGPEADAIRRTEEQVMAQIEPMVTEDRLTSGHETRTCLTTRFPIVSPGRPLLIGNISVDISARKQAEEDLRKSELLYQSLVEHLPQFIFRKDLAGRFTYASARFCQALGRKPEQVVGQTDLELYPQEQAEKYRRDDRRVVESGKVFEAVESRFAPGGTEQIYHVTRMPLHDEHGQIVGVQGILWDITQQKRAEETQRRLATAVEQSGEAILITNVDGAIIYVNPAFEKITGYSRAEVIGQNPRVLKSGKHDADFYRTMWDTLIQGKVWTGRLTNKRKGGALYEENATISPMRDSMGRITHYVGVKLDITRQVDLEEQLRQSQKMEAIGQLAGGIAHDFNNIMTAILGNCQLAARKVSSDARLSGFIEDIKQSALRASLLTRQLLTFSRKEVMRPQVLNLNDVIVGVKGMLARLIGEDITFIVNPAPSPVIVKADVSHVEQIIMNLVVNARDAMPDGGTLTISTANLKLTSADMGQHAKVKPGDYALLSVADTGTGMSAEVKAHLFEPFFTTKETGKGTGLGLATIYGIVAEAGGQIVVQSEPGQGATFEIYLPQMAGILEEAERSPKEKPVAGGKETILLVEDEAIVREMARVFLTDLGYTVLEAKNGTAALQTASKHQGPIHLLLTDMVMPKMTGRTLAQKLAAKRPQMKVLYMSGYPRSAEISRTLLPDGAAFVPKPFTSESLGQSVRQTLELPAV